jgi:hypothetical protein
MLFNVPQFIDIEDKIVGPLTGKQLGWLALGAVVVMVLWFFLNTVAFYGSAVVVALMFGALAFYKPYNQTLLAFIMSSVYFMTRPRMYIWKRLPEAIKPIAKRGRKDERPHEKKKLSGEKIGDISRMLDFKKK